QRIFERFPAAKMLGVTATPDRGDKRNLGKVFESVAYVYGLRQAVADGNLCRITAQTVPLKVDLSGVGTKAGDYSESDVGAALDPYLERIALEVSLRCRERKTLAFLPLCVTSRRTAKRSRRGWPRRGRSCVATPCCSQKALMSRPSTACCRFG
ncbi:hypothetical protein JZU48_03660, partial [bacterium]|nr:hypothetical protein [bacterium]